MFWLSQSIESKIFHLNKRTLYKIIIQIAAMKFKLSAYQQKGNKKIKLIIEM